MTYQEVSETINIAEGEYSGLSVDVAGEVVIEQTDTDRETETARADVAALAADMQGAIEAVLADHGDELEADG